jgi:3-ketoacyl-CoA synthase
MLLFSAVLIFNATVCALNHPRPVYLMDFTGYKLPDHLRVPFQEFVCHSRLCDFSDDALQFQCKILSVPTSARRCTSPRRGALPPAATHHGQHAHRGLVVMFGALDDLFKSTGMKQKDIYIIMVNCSLFHPTLSLSTIIVNRYKLQ